MISSFSKKTSYIKRIVSKPLPVIAFRVWQYLHLLWLQKISFWGRLSVKLYSQLKIKSNFNYTTVLIHPETPNLSEFQRIELKNTTDAVLSSDFKIFNHFVPKLTTCDFSTDWRFGKKWPNLYYKKYNFYEEKTIPYDVKFPWELSRFHYLVPVFAWQWAGVPDYKALKNVFELLTRWRNENPLAHSVNWYPMEASMRILNLAIMLDFVQLIRARKSLQIDVLDELTHLLRVMIAEHGYFVWFNREYTDIRGNHFTANLLALLLAAAALGIEKSAFLKWKKYALRWLDKEISLQFYNDGVNFEKSCAYHKLVLEFFMLAAVARDRLNAPFSQANKNILALAASYSDAVTRPDGLAANFGDTDDAVALPFNLGSPRSHGAIVELARAYFNKCLGSMQFQESSKLAAMFLLGRSTHFVNMTNRHEVLNFPEGGYLIVRNQHNGFFFMVDIGEVGMLGRGGHGHNDLLSFELCISGTSIVVDPGCSGYTSDLRKKNYFRGTASHATIQLFGEEIARFNGPWGIYDDARPLGVSIVVQGERLSICCGHKGYDRINAGTQIFRIFSIDPQIQAISVLDRIEVPRRRTRACWRFPLGQLQAKNITSGEVELASGLAFAVSSDLDLSIVEAPFSHGYGHEITGNVIAASVNLSEGSHVFQIDFRANH